MYYIITHIIILRQANMQLEDKNKERNDLTRTHQLYNDMCSNN